MKTKLDPAKHEWSTLSDFVLHLVAGKGEEVGPRRPSPSRLVALGPAQGRVDALAERPERTRAAKDRSLVTRRPHRIARQL